MTSKAGSLRLWWLVHGEKMGLVAGVLIVVAFFGLTGLFLIDTGPATPAYGKVTGFRALESDTGTYTVAQVMVGGRPISVGMAPRHQCAVGDRIELLRRKQMWFQRYTVAMHACR